MRDLTKKTFFKYFVLDNLSKRNRIKSSWRVNHHFQHSTPLEDEIRLYDSKNIDTLIWPDSEDGDYAKRFLIPLIKNGVHYYIDNLHTEMKVLKMNGFILPITINHAEYDNSHVCSPYSHYISYAIQSLEVIKNSIMRFITKGFLLGLAKILRWGKINRVILVNNWPFSTNLYPKLSENAILAITAYLQKQFPTHAIMFRSIDTYANKDHYYLFKKNDFMLIASRQVYFTDTTNNRAFETRPFKRDLRLLESSNYEVLDNDQLSPDDFSRILQLYQVLYIDKYSDLNPKLNSHFIKLAVENRILHFKALKKNGLIDGVVGYFHCNGIMTSPFYGYDTSKPQDLGLYRLISTILMLEARKNQMLLHQSAGASFYKKSRGAEGALEYAAVYHKHLSYLRRITWSLLKFIFNSIGISYMKKY